MNFVAIIALVVALLTAIKLSLDIGERVYTYYSKLHEQKNKLLPPKPQQLRPLFGSLTPAGEIKKNLLA